MVAAIPLLSPANAVSVGPNVFVNEAGPIDANNSPTLVRNPLLETNLVITHRVDRPQFSALLHSSLDGGATWASITLPLPAGMDRPFAPDVAFAPDGTLFVSYVNLEGLGNVPANLWVATSKDGGRTLSDPVRVAGKLAFQARLAMDHDNTVHLTWLQANEVGLLKLVGGPNPIVASRSTDGGQTFTAPVVVSDPQRERVGAASPVIDSEGRLVVLYQDFKGDRRDFEFLEGPAWGEPFALVVTRSDDGGRTFSRGVEVDNGL
ncbi:MAG: glycoside hydrolase, partial [Actinobacteria bacterium]|nr:glycoside hydrolase [Actinomycetota bacterium]